MVHVVVLIVAYRNALDVAQCVSALAAACPQPGFDVYVAENGGGDGIAALLARLASEESPCVADPTLIPPATPAGARRLAGYRLPRPQGGPETRVFVAQAPENLGYAGGVNFWLQPLLRVEGWDAAWILNPDTAPAPEALRELAAYAERSGKGMVGSCIVRAERPDIVATRGLVWRKWHGRPLAVDRLAPVAVEPDAAEVEARLWAPSGASVYSTRRLIDEIGLMDERYFLYFEDLEWGDRARRRPTPCTAAGCRW